MGREGRESATQKLSNQIRKRLMKCRVENGRRREKTPANILFVANAYTDVLYSIAFQHKDAMSTASSSGCKDSTQLTL